MKGVMYRRSLQIGPEEILQRQLADFLNYQERRLRSFRWFHVPNGGHTSPVLGARRKRIGARAGVPDILIELEGGRIVEIEVKADKGRLSARQKLWAEGSERLGIPHYVVRSLADLEAVLRAHVG